MLKVIEIIKPDEVIKAIKIKQLGQKENKILGK